MRAPSRWRLWVAVASALLGLVAAGSQTPAGAASYLGGRFAVHGAAGHSHSYNVHLAGPGLTGDLQGWHLDMEYDQVGDCLYICVVDRFRWALTSGTDALWGGCYKDAQKLCRQSETNQVYVDQYTCALHLPGAVSGGAGRFADATGRVMITGYVEECYFGSDPAGLVKVALALR